MTTNIEQFTSAGVELCYWARNNANGYPMGATGTLANGADSAMQRLRGINTLDLALQQPRRVSVPGDDGVQSVFFFEAAELPSGNLVAGVLDANFVSQSQGTKVYADSDVDAFVMQPSSPTYNQMTLMTVSQAKSKMSGSSGQEGWLILIYPKVQVVPLFQTGLQNATDTSFTHAIIANKSDKLPWGESFSLANHGTTEAVGYGYYSENRQILHTFVADGTDTTFTLTETPAAASGSKAKAYKGGSAQTYTTHYSLDVSTKVVTLAAAGSAGDIWVIREEYVRAAA